MANEVYVSAQGDTLATNIFARRLEMLLHQRPFARRLCAYKGDTRGSSSDTLKTGQIDDDDIAESVAEGSAVTGNTALTDGSYTLTPARQAIKRVLSNLMAGIDGTGFMKEAQLAGYNFNACMRAFDALVATAVASLTGTAGSTGVDLAVTDWLTATQTLRSRRVTGKKAAWFHPEQFNNLQNSLRTETGPYQLNMEVGDIMATGSGDNLVGFFQGIPIWTTTQVADANTGADHGGAIMQIPADSSLVDGKYLGDAALAFAEGSPEPVSMANGTRMMAPGGVVYTEFDNDIDKADAQLVTNYFVAVGVADAAKGIKVITDHA